MWRYSVPWKSKPVVKGLTGWNNSEPALEPAFISLWSKWGTTILPQGLDLLVNLSNTKVYQSNFSDCGLIMKKMCLLTVKFREKMLWTVASHWSPAPHTAACVGILSIIRGCFGSSQLLSTRLFGLDQTVCESLSDLIMNLLRPGSGRL